MRYLFYLLAFFFLNSCAVLKPQQTPIQNIIQNFENENGPVMIVAHRANIYDSLPENSLEGIKACIDHQIDIIEIDIRKTKDNVLIVLHDESLNRMTNGKGRVSDYTWDEISQLHLRVSSYGKITPYKVPRLDEVFALCKGKIMINLDKGFWYLDEASQLAKDMGVTQQLILKSFETREEINNQMGSFSSLFFMPILAENTFNNTTILDDYLDKNKGYIPEAFELIFDEKSDSIGQPIFIKNLHKNGARVWINTLSDGLSGGRGERKNPEENWQQIIDLGASIIQTDYCLRLQQYLQKTQQ